MFSFHATKVFNTIEGGAVTSMILNKQVLNDLKILELQVGDSEYVGGNAKMNEFCSHGI